MDRRGFLKAVGGCVVMAGAPVSATHALTAPNPVKLLPWKIRKMLAIRNLAIRFDRAVSEIKSRKDCSETFKSFALIMLQDLARAELAAIILATDPILCNKTGEKLSIRF